MIIHEEKQGSDEWLALRATHFTASEAPMMMGASKNVTRNELLKMKATGTDKEISDFVQKNIFDKGHEVEALARPIIEKWIDEDLFPVVGSIVINGMKVLASFDGLTMMDDIVFEHKQWNSEKATDIIKSDYQLMPEFYWQLEQQMLVSGADKAVWVMSDGTKENMVIVEYPSQKDRVEQLLAGWQQFAEDLENYENKEVIEAVGKTVEELPALMIRINGEVTDSNLEIYKSTALEFISNIKTDLQTDQDFADADKMVKFCKSSEQELEATKKQALAQTVTIDQMFKTVDFIKEELRQTRLKLEKLVKAKKADIRWKIVSTADDKLSDFINDIQVRWDNLYLPSLDRNFNGVVKGKKTIDSINNAVDTELARLMIEAKRIKVVYEENLTYLEDKDDYNFLFNDLQQIIYRTYNEFVSCVDARIIQHQEKERIRLEAEKEKIQKEADRRIEQEKLKIKQDEEQKARLKVRAEMAEQQKTATETEKKEKVVQAKSEVGGLKKQTPMSDNEKTARNALYLWLKKKGIEKGIAYNVVSEIASGDAPYVKFLGE